MKIQTLGAAMEITKPRRLRRGDRVALLSPSGAAASFFPHRVSRGVSAIKELGFVPVLFPTLEKYYGGSAGTPKERVADIHKAFQDPDISAIVAAIGGLTLNEILGLLDYDLIAKNPKIFCGYSDCTLLCAALLTQANLISFYGPALLTQFAEYPSPFDYTLQYFSRAICNVEPVGIIYPSDTWTDELLDWGKKLDLTRPRNCVPNQDSHIWLREGIAKGKSLAGCVPSLASIIGTRFSPDYTDKILFLETPEGQEFGKGQPLDYINAEMATLRLHGIFDKIKGLVVGRLYGHPDPNSHYEYMEIIKRQTDGYKFPVVANVNFGHTDPIITIPYHVEVELNSEQKRIEIVESGVT